MKFVKAILEVSGSEHTEMLSKSLIYATLGTKKSHEIVQYALEKELTADGSYYSNSLFRVDRIGVKLFQAYTKVVGLQYIWNTLGEFLLELEEEKVQVIRNRTNTSENVKITYEVIILIQR